MKKNRLNYFEKGIKNPKNAWYVVRTNLDIMASRLIFKNTAGFKNNLEGKNIEKQLKKLQENSSAMSGPLHFQSIQRTQELIKKGYKTRHDYNLPIEIIEDPKHVLKHVGSIGSTVWVNTQYCLHRAGIPKPNHARDMLQLRIIPSREPLYEDWLDRCEDSNDEIRFNSQK